MPDLSNPLLISGASVTIFITGFSFIYKLLKDKVSQADYDKRNNYIDRDVKGLKNDKLDLKLYEADKKSFDETLKRIEQRLCEESKSNAIVQQSLHELEKHHITNIGQAKENQQDLKELKSLVSAFLGELKEVQTSESRLDNKLSIIQTKMENCNERNNSSRN